jgi:hypothetical protein
MVVCALGVSSVGCGRDGALQSWNSLVVVVVGCPVRRLAGPPHKPRCRTCRAVREVGEAREEVECARGRGKGRAREGR